MLRPEPITKGSSTKPVEWQCDCGKTFWKPPVWISNGSVTSCGKCFVRPIEFWASSQFGSLRMKNPVDANENSSRKVLWICSCGKEVLARIILVTHGRRKSCGKCDVASSVYWEETKFGKLRMERPVSIHKGSGTVVTWLCDCGNSTRVSVGRVTSGVTSSCGKCSWLGSEFWASTRFGKLSMKNPELVAPHSDKKVEWNCECGRVASIMVHHVFSGATQSCGKCDWVDLSFWNGRKFGKLSIEAPIEIGLRSSKKVRWNCACGGSKVASICLVTAGNVKSCSKCYDRGLDWYESNRQQLVAIETPIQPESVPKGWIVLLEPVILMKSPVQALCGACKSPYRVRWYDVKTGRALTCGCITFRISKPNLEIVAFLESLGLRPSTEFKIGRYKYDVAIPESKLLVELNGLRWHSFPSSRKRDLEKFRSAVDNGWKCISIYEDEWSRKRSQMETLIRNSLGLSRSQPVRLSACSLIRADSKAADSFYESFHYIGGCQSSLNYAITHDGSMIACASFKKPSRQSEYDWELVRMASHPSFRVHGVWSKILKVFLKDHPEESIVSFSDNRLFSGGVYEKIGFQFDGDVSPDYYWVKGVKRFHKSGLRKKNEERMSGKTESQLRTEQGYRKIWDVGKKRWILRSNHA